MDNIHNIGRIPTNQIAHLKMGKGAKCRGTHLESQLFRGSATRVLGQTGQDDSENPLRKLGVSGFGRMEASLGK
jgi:hypothetical protein